MNLIALSIQSLTHFLETKKGYMKVCKDILLQYLRRHSTLVPPPPIVCVAKIYQSPANKKANAETYGGRRHRLVIRKNILFFL